MRGLTLVCSRRRYQYIITPGPNSHAGEYPDRLETRDNLSFIASVINNGGVVPASELIL